MAALRDSARYIQRTLSYQHQVSQNGNFVLTNRKLIIFGGILLSITLIIVPSFIRWMLVGATIATAIMMAYIWLVKPEKQLDVPVTAPELSTLPPLEIPEINEAWGGNDELSAWFNELEGEYDSETYKIQQTTSVFLQLKSTELSLKTPKRDIKKFSMWDEDLPTSCTFIKQRKYDLDGAEISLLPNDLTGNRFWSKKYPICLLIPSHSQNSSSSDLSSLSQGRKQSLRKVKLLLFARCSPEKEEWYRRLAAASSGEPLPTNILNVLTNSYISQTTKKSKLVSSDSTTNLSHTERLASYLDYMAGVIPTEVQKTWKADPDRRIPGHTPFSHAPAPCEPQLAWLNSIITRCFWDCLKDKHWLDVIQNQLQYRLGKIRVPYFMEELMITGLDPGRELPVIQRAAMPYIDDRGMWANLDISYTGGFCMQIETKCNLLKLTKREAKMKTSPSEDKLAADIDSDFEDSGDSSSEEAEEETRGGLHRRSSKRDKLFRAMEKFAHSKYVQRAAENKYIKKKIDKISNARLVLAVEVEHISGCLAITIPHPPTNRIWFGFRTNPCLRLKASPSIGDKKVGYSRIVDWIEKKLAFEFQRLAVMPNMQNIPIALMSDQPSPVVHKSPEQS